MSQIHDTTRRRVCPLLDQRGEDAVQNWRQVLASIDPATLPADLRAELQALRAAEAASDRADDVPGGPADRPRGWRRRWLALVGLLRAATAGANHSEPSEGVHGPALGMLSPG